jgi:hypothetical protein
VELISDRFEEDNEKPQPLDNRIKCPTHIGTLYISPDASNRLSQSNRWLDDELLDKISGRLAKAYSGKCYTISAAQSRVLADSSLSAASLLQISKLHANIIGNREVQSHEFRYIFAVHQAFSHWFLLVIDIQKKHVLCLDSLGLDTQKLAKVEVGWFLDLADRFGVAADKSSVEQLPDAPHQFDSNNCGCFVLMYQILLCFGLEVDELGRIVKHVALQDFRKFLRSFLNGDAFLWDISWLLPSNAAAETPPQKKEWKLQELLTLQQKYSVVKAEALDESDVKIVPGDPNWMDSLRRDVQAGRCGRECKFFFCCLTFLPFLAVNKTFVLAFNPKPKSSSGKKSKSLLSGNQPFLVPTSNGEWALCCPHLWCPLPMESGHFGAHF